MKPKFNGRIVVGGDLFMKRLSLIASFFIVWWMTACQTTPGEPQILRLATTTSTDNSGLLDAILPLFEIEYNARVDVVAVGTGQALALGEAGDVDVILVHARVREDAFVAQDHGTARYDVMYNDFVLVGPIDDPAAVKDVPLAADALAQIARAETLFASRGDDSGTHTKELALWTAGGLADKLSGAWYQSLGQGMGNTLIFANERGSYTLTDRGTFLSMQQNLPNLVIMVGGKTIAENADSNLYNPYGVIPINPGKGNIAGSLAADFATWLTSPEIQVKIGAFGQEAYGQPLFYAAKN
jgi:tungstate transport system substrate-binding protein